MADQILLLEKALEAAPDNWPVRRYLIEYYASEGKVDRAAEFVKQAPEIPEEEAEQLFAAEVLAKSEPQEAQSLLDDVLRANAACARAHVVKAAIQRLAGHDDKANSHIKVAEVLDPELDVESAIAEAVAKPEAPAGELPLEVSQAVQVYTTSVAAKSVVVVADEEQVDEEDAAVVEVVEEVAEEAAPTVEIEEENPEEEGPVVPVPLSAVPLRPPGMESEPIPIAPKDSEYAGGSILPAAPVLEVEEEEEIGVAALADGERSFIVGDGELLHAHAKDTDTKEKLSAISTAILVHIGIIALLAFYVIAQPAVEPPSIVVSSSIDDNPDEMPDKKIVKKQQKAVASVQQASPVVTVNSYSAIAVPDITDNLNDVSLITLGNDSGTIGMSMTGLGDISNMGSIPAAMRSRCSMSQRMARLRKSGGEERAERAVRDALEYLASKQNKETGAIGTEYPAAMTGLSLLAFLGHCETPESKIFGNSVLGAAQYLMRRGRDHKEGMIFNGEASGNHSAYEHGIATYALCELFTMTKESGREIPQLESVLRRAVNVIVDGQTRDGGWLYGYKGDKDGDYSVSGWQVQALKAAYNTGKEFSGVEKALDKAMEYTKEAQDSAGAIRYRLGDPKGKKTLAGAGILALQMWSQGDAPQVKLGLEYLDKTFANPTPGSDFYTPYYNTQAYFMEGGKQWDAYNAKFQKQLLDAQNEDGSWLKVAAGKGHGPKKDNPIYGTALGALMLEVYYRYLPTTQKLDGL